MNIHPGHSDLSKQIQASLQFVYGRSAQALEWTPYRKVIGRMSHGRHPIVSKCAPYSSSVDAPGGRGGRLQSQVNELKTHFRHPPNLVDNVLFGMIHGSD
jgi:hypothetical protein